MEPLARLYRPGDPVQEHIAAIYREFGLQFDPLFEDDLLDVGDTYRHGAFWVVEGAAPRADGGPPAILATAAVLPHGPARVIKRIYVAREGRRGGLARRLVRMAAEWGAFARTELWSDVRFRDAHRLYASEGFVAGPVRVLDDPDRSVERYFSR